MFGKMKSCRFVKVKNYRNVHGAAAFLLRFHLMRRKRCLVKNTTLQ